MAVIAYSSKVIAMDGSRYGFNIFLADRDCVLLQVWEALLVDFSAFISLFSARFCVILKDWRIVGKLIFLRCVW
jgi:hypothetical protein